MNSPSLFPEYDNLPWAPAPTKPTRTRDEIYNDYDGFVEKFKKKRTTDDCDTPAYIYEAVKQWVNDNVLPLDGVPIVRPFYPGGDYEESDYPPGCVVLDNPPFSILSKIRRFYNARGIRYFLFAPSLTLFSSTNKTFPETFIVANADIIYENEAIVNTSFITNMMPGLRVFVAGALCDFLKAVIKTARKQEIKQRHKISYPQNLMTPALLGKIAERGIELKFKENECHFVRKLDNATGQIFGGGFLISEKAAAEKAAAEKAAAEKAAAELIELSAREKAIIAALG